MVYLVFLLSKKFVFLRKIDCSRLQNIVTGGGGLVCVYVYSHDGFICLYQLECQGTDQQFCVQDVSFLCQVPLVKLWNEAPSFCN